MAIRQVTMADRQPVYRSAFAGKLSTKDDQLIDQGSNGSLAGADMRILHTSQRSVMINGIDNHHLPIIPVGTCCGVVITHRGPAIAVCHERVGNTPQAISALAPTEEESGAAAGIE